MTTADQTYDASQPSGAMLKPGGIYLIKQADGNNVRVYRPELPTCLLDLAAKPDAANYFHLMPINSARTTFWIVNANRGELVMPENLSSAADTNLVIETSGQQRAWAANTLTHWAIVGDGAAYEITNASTSLYARRKKAGDPPLVVGDDDETLARFTLHRVNHLPKVENLAHIDTDPSQIGDVNRLKGFQQPRMRTDEVLIGQVAIPFLAINEPGKDTTWQAKHSPYYIVRRYGYWQQVLYYEHAGNSNYTKTEEAYIGLTTRNAQVVEETTNIRVSLDLAFSYEGFSSAVSSSYEHELKVTTTSEEVKEQWKKVTVSRDFKNDGKRVALCVWYRGDHYTVHRIDSAETLIADWRTLTETGHIDDGWPKN
ncbi:hypothetical protein AB0O28_21510 [Microbispora sp. NPDC088329]|uniref:hypothetical protein n=1 Tax=Microbispora sp. NPDC088329 TaxID=3154869 RepID=UPI00343E8F3A